MKVDEMVKITDERGELIDEVSRTSNNKNNTMYYQAKINQN